jgi:xanthine dehydrogenase small subunit
MLDGKALMTVESLADGALHPVQREMVARHGSQCGFCTPGFVMSLYGRSVGAPGTAGTPVADVMAGNLCRCTGYGPILDAGEAVPPSPAPDDRATATALRRGPARYSTLSHADPVSGRHPSLVRAAHRRPLAALLVEHPDARIVAGATDVGLWVTKQHRDLDTIIDIGEVADLRRSSTRTRDGLTIGAGVRYSMPRRAGAAPSRSGRTGAAHRVRPGAQQPGRSAAISPTARRSATCRRR